MSEGIVIEDREDRDVDEATARPWVADPWGIWTAGGPKGSGARLFDADRATDGDVILAVEAVNAYDRLRAIEAAMQTIRTKVEAAAYHRNYRQACIDISEIIFDLHLPVSEVPSDAR